MPQTRPSGRLSLTQWDGSASRQELHEIQAISVTKTLDQNTIKTVGKVEADGIQAAEGFVVLQGSHISPIGGNTIPAVVKERRQKSQIDDDHILQEDLLFTSPSYAAMFVVGKNANGLTSWKTADGQTLKSLEADTTDEA